MRNNFDLDFMLKVVLEMTKGEKVAELSLKQRILRIIFGRAG